MNQKLLISFLTMLLTDVVGISYMIPFYVISLINLSFRIIKINFFESNTYNLELNIHNEYRNGYTHTILELMYVPYIQQVNMQGYVISGMRSIYV